MRFLSSKNEAEKELPFANSLPNSEFRVASLRASDIFGGSLSQVTGFLCKSQDSGLRMGQSGIRTRARTVKRHLISSITIVQLERDRDFLFRLEYDPETSIRSLGKLSPQLQRLAKHRNFARSRSDGFHSDRHERKMSR